MVGASNQLLSTVQELKYGPAGALGWTARLRRHFGYISPDDLYECLLFQLVDSTASWLDVGCGRAIFPWNPKTAEILAGRCKHLTGLDPSDNIGSNPLLHERAKCLLQDYQSDRQFDLITLRMVAEHITEPVVAVSALARLTKPGGRVIIYTVYKWSPAAIVAALTPQAVHFLAAKLLWQAEERDVFPTAYKMNTRRKLQQLFHGTGFQEESFQWLDDCRTFSRWKTLSAIELAIWRLCRFLGLRYPELCILATYIREDGESG